MPVIYLEHFETHLWWWEYEARITMEACVELEGGYIQKYEHENPCQHIYKLQG